MNAEQRFDKIKRLVSQAGSLLIEAFDNKDWIELGYDSWDAYCKALETHGFRLPREQRIKTVVALKEREVSNVRIAESLGVSEKTVRRDLATSALAEPATKPQVSVGKDGKKHPASKPKPKPQRPKPTLDDEMEAEAMILAQGGVIPDRNDYGPSAPTEDIVVSEEILKKNELYRHLKDAERAVKQAAKVDVSAIAEARSIKTIRSLIDLISELSVKTVERVES